MENEKERTAEKAFKNFGKRVDNFIEELKEASDRLEQEYQEKYSDLKASAKKVKEEINNTERWKEVEESLEKAGEELKKAFKAAFKKTKE